MLVATTLASAAAETGIVVTPPAEISTDQRTVPLGVAPTVVYNEAKNVQMPAGAAELLDTILAWNTTTNEVHVEAGAQFGKFTFAVTNVSSAPVTINSAPPSCGCTTANLDLPKIIQPKEHVEFDVMMNVSGKHGTVEKTISINTDKGSRILIVRTIIPLGDVAMMNESERKDNLLMATADRQAVFLGDCARCHVEPAHGKMGKELFAAVCAVCHESPHRASMVPDLHNLKVETSAAFWMTWITYGKPGGLMPAFSQGQRGILTREQIASLVDYLVETIPSRPAETYTKAK